ncbi:L-2-hydroxyglutarate oxidase [Nitrospiraceae bacterium AH_259_D15_M11_P09]|nr:L-2-hydroxyglutarate oxidase [Nitrospiraceae bacterium AH_259_D15_M11_P09]
MSRPRTSSYDVAIIGGGIIGCALANELGKRFSKVVLIEKEASVGLHTSGRNSGVVHSGFNTQPGTLKAKLCVEGSRKIREFCKQRKIACEQVGTYVAAVEEAQIPILYELKSRGEKNSVPDLEILPIERVREQEPNAKGIAALFAPTGAIVDCFALTRSLADGAKQLGVTLKLGEEVGGIEEREEGVYIQTRNGNFAVDLVINCAGLHADRLAHMMGLGRDYVMAPFRGEYFEINRAGQPIINSMIYPVPNPVVPFLGIHLTRTVRGSVLIGPNAVPAFGREAYGLLAFNFRDLAEMLRHRGLWNALRRNRALVNVAWREFRHSCSKRHFFREASCLVTGLSLKDLTLGTRVGIRPQLIRSDGHLVEDLVVETTPRSIHILNVVSPGMTSALAFAKWLVGGIDDNLQWLSPLLK